MVQAPCTKRPNGNSVKNERVIHFDICYEIFENPAYVLGFEIRMLIFDIEVVYHFENPRNIASPRTKSRAKSA